MTKTSRGLTSRSPVGGLIRPQSFRDARLFVIATEGSVTEPHYFSIFSDSVISQLRSHRVRRLEILPSSVGSAPNHVIAALDKYKTENQIVDGDELWLVIDVDRWISRGLLPRVVREAKQKGYYLAISNPCFEAWLLYHYAENLPENKAKILADAKYHCGNTKKEFSLEPLIKRIKDAAKNAEADDPTPAGPWPRPRGSHVYRLIKKLLSTGC